MKELVDRNIFIAHVRKDEEAFKIQILQEYLTGISVLSESFASVFGASGWENRQGYGMIWESILQMNFSRIFVMPPE